MSEGVKILINEKIRVQFLEGSSRTEHTLIAIHTIHVHTAPRNLVGSQLQKSRLHRKEKFDSQHTSRTKKL